MASAKKKSQLRRSLIAPIVAALLFHGCSTKVGNPNNDNDQKPNAELLAMPNITGEFKLPQTLDNLDKIDPLYKSVLLDILAVGYVAASIPGSLNKFFTALAEKKFLSDQTFSIEDQGRILTGKTWTQKTEIGVTAGIWFCDGQKPVGYMTWGDQSRNIEFVRDLSVPILIQDEPMIAGLDGKARSVVAPNGSTLESYYMGKRRDPVTYETQDTRAVMQFSAVQKENGSYTMQGSGVDQEDPNQIPAEGETRAYGVFAPDATGEILIHLPTLCPAFQDNINDPNWCFHATLKSNSVEVFDGDADTKWPAIRDESVPLPTHDRLKAVTFPETMTCP